MDLASPFGDKEYIERLFTSRNMCQTSWAVGNT